ncbi:MAG TPA: SCO family protein [Verrucomicrobiae bacterium]|jgi:protein SCO1/2|nr:SCO family protein [Verrucomicrobiae bacterium]
MFRLFSVLLLAVFASSAGAQTNQEIHPAKGVVIEVTPAEKKITIKHGDIPGYMGGMTMPFDVKDTNELSGLAPGDPVSFRIVVSGNEGWIDQIRKIGPRTNLPPATAPVRTVREVQPLDEGDLLPNYHFTNQLGEAVSTGQFKGQALAITFLFTRCPFPNFCPLMANNFAEVQKKLLAMPNAPTNWHLLTISFDPEFDTPQVLKQYAEAHGADPARWTFATGALDEIAAMGQQFGLAFWKEQAGIISHNLRTVVIDPSGRVQKIFTGNDWQPPDLVAEMVKAAKVRNSR